ncbi:hypothetical protein Pcinc_039786 [Petrolisthes cinctipes]|uniref:Uncharacterized protein n=1 Tax=Petrolisthes cinctipes TaxID=88211 RepID=A0AAE1BN99_PETCI|nr:hypothetical protein Pcinc_039786 [Petrolisthes cinctipes]
MYREVECGRRSDVRTERRKQLEYWDNQFLGQQTNNNNTTRPHHGNKKKREETREESGPGHLDITEEKGAGEKAYGHTQTRFRKKEVMRGREL